MKYKYLIILLSLATLGSFSLLKNKEQIPWSNEYKLKWEDFKKKKEVYEIKAAVSVISIHVFTTYSGEKVKFKVTNNFIEHESYVDGRKLKLSDTLSFQLLEHEQLHFDIAELHTRIMRKRLNELNTMKGLTMDFLKSEIANTYKQRDQMDSLFDLQTKHGTIKSEQLQWQQAVKSQLIELEAYYESNIRD